MPRAIARRVERRAVRQPAEFQCGCTRRLTGPRRGEVHTKAGKFVVRKESPPYKVGDVLWVYTRLGEGYYRVWHAGAMVAEEIFVAPDHPNPDDWGYFETAPGSTWWIGLRKQDGLEGWTDAPEHFSGTHSCG